jgi:hypothetical protein
LGRLRQEDNELEARLGYIVSSRPAWTVQQNTVSKTNFFLRKKEGRKGGKEKKRKRKEERKGEGEEKERRKERERKERKVQMQTRQEPLSALSVKVQDKSRFLGSCV